MPFEQYIRGHIWWVRGAVEFNGKPITGYYRKSTGASSEAGARDWITEETARQRRRYILGAEDSQLTFAAAVMLYPAKPREAAWLMPIVAEIGERPVASLKPKEIRAMAQNLYPDLSTDTWQRYVITPVRAVILNAHEEGLCPAIRIRGYTVKERIDQDTRRGQQSRKIKSPMTRDWVAAFTSHADAYNAAMVTFIFQTGARIDQVVCIQPKHLDLMNHRIKIKAQKGHPEQWVMISTDLVVALANLPARRPHNRKSGKFGTPRVFGYGSRSGMCNAWRSICKLAGIPYLSPHCGRHGFYTELRVNQGIDPITAAKMGRWTNHDLPDRVYAHSDADERAIREGFSTNTVQPDAEDASKA